MKLNSNIRFHKKCNDLSRYMSVTACRVLLERATSPRSSCLGRLFRRQLAKFGQSEAPLSPTFEYRVEHRVERIHRSGSDIAAEVTTTGHRNVRFPVYTIAMVRTCSRTTFELITMLSCLYDLQLSTCRSRPRVSNKRLACYARL